jgi:hypothetical protein
MVRTTTIAALETAEARLAAADRVSAEDQLRFFAAGWWEFLRTDRFQVVQRLVMAELPQFPDLMQFYADEVVARGRRLVSAIISRGSDRGEFRAIDPEVGARMLALAMTHASGAHVGSSSGAMQRTDDDVPMNDRLLPARAAPRHRAPALPCVDFRMIPAALSRSHDARRCRRVHSRASVADVGHLRPAGTSPSLGEAARLAAKQSGVDVARCVEAAEHVVQAEGLFPIRRRHPAGLAHDELGDPGSPFRVRGRPLLNGEIIGPSPTVDLRYRLQQPLLDLGNVAKWRAAQSATEAASAEVRAQAEGAAAVAAICAARASAQVPHAWPIRTAADLLRIARDQLGRRRIALDDAGAIAAPAPARKS